MTNNIEDISANIKYMSGLTRAHRKETRCFETSHIFKIVAKSSAVGLITSFLMRGRFETKWIAVSSGRMKTGLTCQYYVFGGSFGSSEVPS